MMLTENSITMSTEKITILLGCKSVFVFDWDGTLFDSMSVKTDNFINAFLWSLSINSHSNFREDLNYYYKSLSGRPRKEIFYAILGILGFESKPSLYERFNLMFEKLNMASLIHAPVFPDASALMKELHQHDSKIYISSSVPPNELQKIVRAALPASTRQHISKVLGSKDGFSKGVEHIDFIKQDCRVTNQQIIVFGDDIADYELSTDAEVDCILVDRSGSMIRESGPIIVKSLSMIKDSLAT